MSLHETKTSRAGRQERDSRDSGVRENRRAIAKIGGLKIYRIGDEIHIPNTPVGRALACVLTGQQYPNRGQIVITIRDTVNLFESLSALVCINQAVSGEAAINESVRDALKRIGVREPVLSELCADAWVTVDRIESHWGDLIDRGEDNPAAKLIARLRNRWKPIVSITPAKHDYSKYEGWD
jgi:hypothetical protein